MNPCANIRRMLLLASVVAIAACSADFGPVQSARDLDGSWTEGFTIPGSGQHWLLSVSGSVVTGSGTWTGEACCSGTLTIQGTVVADSVHLDIVSLVTGGVARGPFSSHFDAALQSPTLLVGHFRGSAGDVEFRKDR